MEPNQEGKHRRSYSWTFRSLPDLRQTNGIGSPETPVKRPNGKSQCGASNLLAKLLAHASTHVSYNTRRKSKNVHSSLPWIPHNLEEEWDELMTESDDVCSFVASRSNSVLVVAPVSCPPPPVEHRVESHEQRRLLTFNSTSQDELSHRYQLKTSSINRRSAPVGDQQTWSVDSVKSLPSISNNTIRQSVNRDLHQKPTESSRHMLSLEYLFYSAQTPRNSDEWSEDCLEENEIEQQCDLESRDKSDRKSTSAGCSQSEASMKTQAYASSEAYSPEESRTMIEPRESRRQMHGNDKETKAQCIEAPRFKKKALFWRLRYKRSNPIKEFFKNRINKKQPKRGK